MRAGRLRHLVAVQSVTKSRTATGGYTDTWATDRTAWAAVEPLAGREYFANAQVQGETTHRITMRYHSALTVHHRIKWGTRLFNPIQVLNKDERRISHEVLAKEEI